jgi:hypothetical protein
MGLSGTWKARAYQQPAVAGARDPAHAQPSQHDTGRNWQTAPANPAEPPREIVDDAALTLDYAPGGPVYNPPGPSQGVGAGAGLSFAASSAQNDAAHNTDDGSYLPRATVPAAERDGTYHVDRMQNQTDVAAIGSPGWVEQQRQLNPEYYPNRRVGHYIKRFRDRVFERRTWGVEFRPIITPNAYTAPPLSAVEQRNQYVSPYADSVATNVRVVNVTAPQLRRTPSAWDESITVDGTAQAPADPGFVSWGL